MFPHQRDAFYSFWPDIRRALRALNVPHSERAKRCTSWEAIPATAIVGCGRRPGNFWHWVVYDPGRGKVHDPLLAKPVSLRKVRRKPFSYLVIEPTALEPRR
jgi:hypothetical protein